MSGPAYRQGLVATDDFESGEEQHVSYLQGSNEWHSWLPGGVGSILRLRSVVSSLIVAATLCTLVGSYTWSLQPPAAQRPGGPGTGSSPPDAVNGRLPQWADGISVLAAREWTAEERAKQKAILSSIWIEGRAGRLPREHRTVTMSGFQMTYLNGRYTERFGIDYVVANHPTYWDETLKFMLYYCEFSSQWKIGMVQSFENIRDNGICDWTAYGPELVDILDFAKARGWWEWISGTGATSAPQAGVHVISLKESLKDQMGSFDIFDIHPMCERPPYTDIDYMKVYAGTLSFRAEMTSQIVFNQGTCNNCWAVTVASLVERLLCIKSSGNWRGPRAAISPAYITSCATSAWMDNRDGCHPGKALEALRWIGQNGVPTGGDEHSETTCVPFFKVNHTGVTKAPQCPTMCTNAKYPRTLQMDSFKPLGLWYSYETTALESAKAAMMRTPVIALIPLYEDLYNYTGGTYVHTTGKHLGSHFLVCHGYSKDYFQCFNSWGNTWGHHGSVRVQVELPFAFVIPGDISPFLHDYPYPLPAALYRVKLAGFKQAGTNGNYDLWTHPDSTVNGHKTYWHGDEHILYWCAETSAWSVYELPAEASGWDEPKWLQEVKQLKRNFAVKCEWVAKGPSLQSYTSIDELGNDKLLGWTEKANGNYEVIAGAGIVGTSTDTDVLNK